MKDEIKKLWTEALRSGEYKQGSGFLRKENNFCCLGVLTDLFLKENSDKGSWGDYDEKSGNPFIQIEDLKEDQINVENEDNKTVWTGHLAYVVSEWAGIKDGGEIICSHNPFVRVYEETEAWEKVHEDFHKLRVDDQGKAYFLCPLSTLNDKGIDFGEIANAIEESF